ncbi:MAG TPA: acetyl-CoA synthase subunit gamma [Deltaproteobacteria bacterium]|nr:acetyl-CoA synthase subunit gamma [Deltaproteobacteria bacterium]
MSLRDWLGTTLVRSGFGRMGYTVEPGLYGVGAPGPDSPVLVTANYKLSFDHLRGKLAGIDAWLVVLETFGINVWCAAGKGSFGTTELVLRVKASRLHELVGHRTIVVPQLGAPGVAAHHVKKRCGFTVRYGPVMARDLPLFLANNMVATPAMRRKTFPFRERLALIPVEMTMAGKWLLFAMAAVLVISGLAGTGDFQQNSLEVGRWPLVYLLAGVFGGGVLTPLLLPYLPGRAFAVKGGVAGLAVAAMICLSHFLLAGQINAGADLAWGVICTAVSSYLGMNFTGASTYTSLSGVKKEMRLAVPAQVCSIVAGSGWWFFLLFRG